MNNENKIILNVYLYIKKGENEYKEKAKELLTKLAAYYKVNLNKRTNIPLEQAFIEFIDNDKGYNTTIVNLFNALN